MSNLHPGARRAIAGAVVILILAAIAARLDWNTMRGYTSIDGGYSIRFPIYFSLHVEEVSVAGSNTFHPVQNVIELDTWGHPRPYILIEYTHNLSYQPIDIFIEDSSECDAITGQQGERVIVAGMEGRIFRNVTCNSNGETRVYLINGRTGYNIIFHGKPVDEKLLSLILSNFSALPTKQ